MDWALIISQSAVIGLVLSAILSVLIIVSLRINPEIWYNDYPDDVKQVFGPMSEKAKRQRTPFAIILFGLIIVAMVYDISRLGESLGGTPPFLAVFISASVVFMIFSLVDAFIIDWLILMQLWPSLGVLPGTEGMAFYHDMGAWAKNLFKSIPISFVVGLITSAIAALVFWVGSLF